jgi:hypothetical protein
MKGDDISALDILVAARSKIADEKDWGKGSRRDRPRNTYCAAEAVEEAFCFNSVFQVPPQYYDERVAAFRALEHAAGVAQGCCFIPNWNDAPERTHKEVLAAFDLAIATLRLGETR